MRTLEERIRRGEARWTLINKTLRLTRSFKHPRYLKRFWRRTGLCPVWNQPGLFFIPATEEIINIRDFAEVDKYDTIVLPAERAAQIVE